MNLNDVIFYRKNGYMPYPKTLQLEITRRCPFCCPQCYKQEIAEKDQDFEYLKGIIEEAYKNGTRLYVLNGGEPLLYPYIKDLLLLFENYNDTVINCFTSGYGLTDEIIEILKKNLNIHFYLSLNGSTAEINGYSRQGYNITIEAMEKLSKANCTFNLNWVARHDNVDDFDKLLDMTRRFAIRTVSVTLNKLVGRILDIESNINKEDYLSLAEIIKNRKDVEIVVESCYPQLAKYIYGSTKVSDCFAGIFNCMVTIDRKFAPCTFLVDYAESFDNIMDYWENSSILQKLRNRKKCKGCEFNCRFCCAISYDSYVDFKDSLENCFMFELD